MEITSTPDTETGNERSPDSRKTTPKVKKILELEYSLYQTDVEDKIKFLVDPEPSHDAIFKMAHPFGRRRLVILWISKIVCPLFSSLVPFPGSIKRHTFFTARKMI